NARIVPVSGPVIAKGTLVVRDGLIAAVGANVAVPADARVVDGAGLTVYPGLIDAYSSVGLGAAAAPTGGGRGGGNPLAALAAHRRVPELADGRVVVPAADAARRAALPRRAGRLREEPARHAAPRGRPVARRAAARHRGHAARDHAGDDEARDRARARLREG